MVPLSHAAAFAVAALVIIVIPGPNVLFAIGRALAHGRRAAVVSVLGSMAGTAVPVIGVAVGLGAILAASAILMTIVKIVGAGYLIYLGAMAIRDRKKLTLALRSADAEPSTGRMVRQGFVVGATNPKTIVFFAAVLPQFAVPEAGALPAQFLTLGAIAITIQLVSDTAWAMAAGTARSWFARSPRRLEAIGGTGGLMIMGVGASVAFSGSN
ncbi:LysE family translocator [Nocardia sp. NPDC050175]|uniref:LysE family translocator n=1 Tax=Nocardia sp. NPDC050175 TaxID=3364317 RepID=UPI0037A377F1